MLAFANTLDLFANKFARLRRRRLAFFLGPAGTFDSFFLGHNTLSSHWL